MPFEHNCSKTTCDHSPTAEETADQWNLNSKIDLENVQCLNEQIDGSAKKIFRSWDERFNREHVFKKSILLDKTKKYYLYNRTGIHQLVIYIKKIYLIFLI